VGGEDDEDIEKDNKIQEEEDRGMFLDTEICLRRGARTLRSYDHLDGVVLPVLPPHPPLLHMHEVWRAFVHYTNTRQGPLRGERERLDFFFYFDNFIGDGYLPLDTLDT